MASKEHVSQPHPQKNRRELLKIAGVATVAGVCLFLGTSNVINLDGKVPSPGKTAVNKETDSPKKQEQQPKPKVDQIKPDESAPQSKTVWISPVNTATFSLAIPPHMFLSFSLIGSVGLFVISRGKKTSGMIQ